MVATYHSNAELVAIAWLKTLDGVPADKVGGDLPDIKTSDWRAAGFIQVMPVAGSPDVYIPRRRPVVQVSCWAGNTNNPAKVPYAKTNQLAEAIVNEVYARTNFGTELSMPTGFAAVRLMSMRVEVEPRRVPDPSNYARTDVDLFFDWMQTEQVA